MADPSLEAEALVLLENQVQGALLVAEKDALAAAAAAQEAAERVHELQAKKAKIKARLTELGVQSTAAIAATLTVNQVATATLQNATLEATGSRMNRREWRQDVIGRIQRMLAGGRRLSTDVILQNLKEQGVAFANVANERHRVTQIMSESDIFRANRKLGWFLADYEFPTIDNDVLTSNAVVTPKESPSDSSPPGHDVQQRDEHDGRSI